MLWCKATFTSHFSDAHCRLFPTQQQMFHFIDAAPIDEAWMPFGIEFPSEAEVTHDLAHRATAKATPLFRQKREREEETVKSLYSPHAQQHPQDRCRRRLRMREDYALLYGAGPLSSQSRMFLAATRSGVADVVRTLEPLQQHLYEVIREGAPCHAYLDVERDRDHLVHMIDSSSSDASSVCIEEEDNNDKINKKEEKEEIEKGEKDNKQEAFDDVTWDAVRSYSPTRCCHVDCPIRADNKETTDVLLTELQSFLKITSPEFLSDIDATNAHATEVNEKTETQKTTECLQESVYPLEVLVLRSTDGAKFSQHYILKLRDRWFRSNADVGSFVTAFVNYLYARATHMPHVHAALFYHDPPHRGKLPLRCVIDGSVYSRNRMLRCLGSCKLHKTGILVLERRIGIGANVMEEKHRTAMPKEQLFLDTLVTYSDGGVHAPPRTCIGMGTQSPYHVPVGSSSVTSGYIGSMCSHRCGHSQNEFTRVMRTVKGFEALSAHIAQAWSNTGGVPCYVTGIRRMGEHILILSLDGSRYCARVGREHRSNRVYVCVDLGRCVWAQKCFDPDCAAFRSQEQKIPLGVMMLTPRESIAVRRTIFRTGELS